MILDKAVGEAKIFRLYKGRPAGPPVSTRVIVAVVASTRERLSMQLSVCGHLFNGDSFLGGGGIWRLLIGAAGLDPGI